MRYLVHFKFTCHATDSDTGSSECRSREQKLPSPPSLASSDVKQSKARAPSFARRPFPKARSKFKVQSQRLISLRTKASLVLVEQSKTTFPPCPLPFLLSFIPQTLQNHPPSSPPRSHHIYSCICIVNRDTANNPAPSASALHSIFFQ